MSIRHSGRRVAPASAPLAALLVLLLLLCPMAALCSRAAPRAGSVGAKGSDGVLVRPNPSGRLQPGGGLNAATSDGGADDDEEEEENAGESDPAGTDDYDPWDQDFCFGKAYRKKTLKAIKDMPYIGLFDDLKDNFRFEASGHVIAKGSSWVVFDNMRTIGKVDLHFNFNNPNSKLLTEEGMEDRESQFEGLAYSASTDTFIIVRESWNSDEGRLIGKTEEVKMDDKKGTFKVIRNCTIDFEFEDENKGFEGIYYFERDGKRLFMGLCESNYCKTIIGKEPPGLDRGHGRLVVAELQEDDGVCEWKTQKVIDIPKKAKFLDYSAIAFHGYMGESVAITSQEDAAVWVGVFDWESLEFDGDGDVWHFPRNEHCEKLYCNVEGIQFLDGQRVALTSDKSKSIQPHSCMQKDQSFHVMALPKLLP